jgi:subtilisin-like proprotein convertase family protein
MKYHLRTTTAALLAGFFIAVAFAASGLGQTGARGKANSALFRPEAMPTLGYRSPGDTHKVSVSDASLVQSLRSQGAREIADYGGYVLFEVNGVVLDSIKDSRGAQVVDENNQILLNAGTIDTTQGKTASAKTLSAKTVPATTAANGGKQMRLIQFAGPIRPEWHNALVETGVRIVTYIPNNAYLVYGGPETIKAVQTLASNKAMAQWDGEYTATHRLDPRITRAAVATATSSKAEMAGKHNLSASGNEQFTIQMVEDPDENKATLALIEKLRLEPIIKQDTLLGYLNVRVTLPKEAVISQIALRPDVVSVQPWTTPRKRDERQDIIITGNVSGSPAVPTPMNYLTYLTGKGFAVGTTSSFAVNLSDSGIDNATTTPNHFGLYRLGDPSNPANSRVIYNRLAGVPNPGSTLQGCDGHGNENSQIIAGYVPSGTVNGVNFSMFPHADALSFRYGLGVAPFVKVGSSVIFDPANFTSPVYSDLESQAYNDGARISSNSWGSSDNSYSVDAQQYDALVRDAQLTGSPFPTAGNQEYIIVFAAGNDGPAPFTVGEPSTAKNVITVGAAENVNPFGPGSDACSVSDTGANNANDIIDFSGRGPTSDGRHKPDIVAPGTHVTSAVAQSSIANPAGSGTGSPLACYDGSGVCGGVNSIFYPPGQQWYTSSSGTSHATPVVAGAAALIRQHFLNQSLLPPSPAMTKALLMNSARYLNGVGANDTLPSNSQGMGEINLNAYFDVFATAHTFRDQRPADTFTASGQQRVIVGTVGSNTKPLRVTLAWTDPPGPTSGNAYVNNLDLEVTVGGNTYKGNVFSGAFSATGGTADTRNNVESVYLPAGVTGPVVITVKATNIAGNGVPGNAAPLNQDYALVAYNVNEAPVPVIGAGAAALTAESCPPGNGAIDPGETVTVNFDFSNVGTANTTNLVATLLATGGVTSPSGAQNYGALVANGLAVTRPFTFTASAACGQTITATFHLQDGVTDLGNVTFSFRTGALGAPVTSSYSTGNVSTPIPDLGSVDIPIIVPDIGSVSNVKVKVRLTHTFDGDLVLTLISPTGARIPLAANRGGSGDDYGAGSADCSGTYTVFDDAAATSIGTGTAPFAGSFRPEIPLAGLAGTNVNGMWILHVADTGPGDVGTLFCVTLDITRQPFACCGATGAPQIIAGGPAVLTAENFIPPNNAVDPGEMVTVSLPLRNTDNVNTTNLVATLQNSGGVNPLTTSQTYGVVVVGGPNVLRSFSFVAGGTCGGTITATLQLQDGPNNLGTVNYVIQTGAPGAPTTTSYSTGPITASIADFTATEIPLFVPDSGLATDVKVKVRLNHTYDSDLRLTIISPTGITVPLSTEEGGGGDNYGSGATNCSGTYTVFDDSAAIAISSGAAPFAGSFRPESPLANLNGSNVNGVWIFRVVDVQLGDTGTIYCVTLDLTKPSYTCVGNQAPLIQTGPPPDGLQGTPYSFQLVASGAPTTISWTVSSGTQPPGLILDASTGLFHGTPTTTGTFNFQVTASNGVLANAVVPYTVVIAPSSPYQSWRVAHFTPAQLADSSISGDSATPAGDGISNLQKYLFGLLPFTHSDNPAVLSNVGGHLVLTFPRSNTATDLTIAVHFSTDLGAGPFGALTTWTSGTGWVPNVAGTTVSEMVGGSTTQVTVTDPTVINTGNQRFLRLRPTVNP